MTFEPCKTCLCKGEVEGIGSVCYNRDVIDAHEMLCGRISTGIISLKLTHARIVHCMELETIIRTDGTKVHKVPITKLLDLQQCDYCKRKETCINQPLQEPKN